MNVNRSAGILMHITSLPSPFCIGDFGPEAYRFADFLSRSNQTYWQLLPLNPTEQGQGNSPYSSISSMAGNILMISPEKLKEDNLLQDINLDDYKQPVTDKVDFENAVRIKKLIFDEAWKTFKRNSDSVEHKQFEVFCKQENHWLNDYAIFILLKDLEDGKPWFEWNPDYRNKNTAVIEKCAATHADALQKTKWLQFIFTKQWKQLKQYCAERGIEFFGDLPFYASYDSVDVWSNRQLFKLDDNGKALEVAGVPPDAFSDEGQLWGMPVYNWKKHKDQQYKWWISRLVKNMEYFDLLRLDHFRAFADYWEVAADAKTARNGSWVTGPGDDFFYAVKMHFPQMPFIAEDLGDINQSVYRLRDNFGLAGMKVLQFAFGHEMPLSPHIPHNYAENFVVYTGTHDNNTIVGWYTNEGINYHHQINHYIGQSADEKNINTIMCRLAYASVAQIAILPVQDVLGLDKNARMNIPASTGENWIWRIDAQMLNNNIEKMLFDWTWLYNRSNKNNKLR